MMVVIVVSDLWDCRKSIQLLLVVLGENFKGANTIGVGRLEQQNDSPCGSWEAAENPKNCVPDTFQLDAISDA
jgi:hypothetical protein